MATTREQFDSLIYTDFATYQALSETDRAFFDKLFYMLILNGKINWSNEKISKVFGEPVSTIEKRLKRVEQAELIIRENKKAQVEGVWRTVERIIRLSPDYFGFDFNSLAYRLFCDYLFYSKNMKILNEILEMDYGEFKERFGKLKVTYVSNI